MLGFGKKPEPKVEELAPVEAPLPATIPPDAAGLPVVENPAPDTIPAPAPPTEQPSEAPVYIHRERRVAPQE